MSSIFDTEKVDAVFYLQKRLHTLSSIFAEVHIAHKNGSKQGVEWYKKQYAEELDRIKKLMEKL